MTGLERATEPQHEGQELTAVRRIAVLGAGTMGVGIAQLALQSGFGTTLYDPHPPALARARALIADGLQRSAKRGVIEERAIPNLLASGRLDSELECVGDADLVIEAAPEVLELKLELFAETSTIVTDNCVLATNTSSFSVTRIAAAAVRPERVVGMHFFNPAPVMKLVEIVAGDGSGEHALDIARGVAEAFGKRVVAAADVAGFLVNRCNRPFSLEALRLLEQSVATFEQIDRIVRMQGGFRMGPFELMDLVGIETNHAVAESMQRQSYGEPRYRPSPLAARKVAAGHLGRKSGRGWYRYDGEHYRSADESATRSGAANGRTVAVIGDLAVARELRTALAKAGFAAVNSLTEACDLPWLSLDCRRRRSARQRRHARSCSTVGHYMSLIHRRQDFTWCHPWTMSNYSK